MKIGNKIFFSFLVILLTYVAFFIVREYMLSAVRGKFSSILPLSNQSLILSEQMNSLNLLESNIDSYILIGSEELKTEIKDYPEESSQKIYAFVKDEKPKEEFETVFSELDENINSFIEINEQPENKFALNNQILKVYESIDKLKKLEKESLDYKTNELQKIIKEQEETTSWITKLSLFSGISVFIIGFSLSILLSRSITKPITKLRDAAKEISKGKLDTKIEIKSEDEIGELASDFNIMTVRLNAYNKELKNYAKELESRVTERTKELGEKLEQLNRVNKLMVDRELRMVELKKEIEELKSKLNA